VGALITIRRIPP